jgi:hypothetical protein
MGTHDLDQTYIRVNNGTGSLTAEVGKLKLFSSAQIFHTTTAITGGLPTQAEMLAANNSLNTQCELYVTSTDPRQFDATDYMTTTRYIVYKEDRDPVGLGATAIRLSATILIYEIVKATGNVRL